jgi:hypothetical protein
MLSIGFDPGKTGGVAVLRDGAVILGLHDMPYRNKASRHGDYNLAQLLALLLPLSPHASLLTARALLADTQELLESATVTATAKYGECGMLQSDEFVDALTAHSNVMHEIANLPRDHEVMAFVERQQPMRGQGKSDGVKAAFGVGLGWGTLRAMCFALGIPVTDLTAARWQRRMQVYGLKLEGIAKKRYHIQTAQRMFPSAEIGTSDGRADALLIARCGWLEHNGSTGS